MTVGIRRGRISGVDDRVEAERVSSQWKKGAEEDESEKVASWYVRFNVMPARLISRSC